MSNEDERRIGRAMADFFAANDFKALPFSKLTIMVADGYYVGTLDTTGAYSSCPDKSTYTTMTGSNLAVLIESLIKNYVSMTYRA